MRGIKIMPSKLSEASPRNFNPMLSPGLSEEARKAVKVACDAMSTWRTEIINNEKNIEGVIDKIAAGARAMGWPDEIVDTTRSQMQTMNKMQLQMMDQMMDAWEEQIKSPNPSSIMLSKLKSLSNFSPAGSWPGSTADPFGVYMQMAQQWQKVWANAMSPWIKQ
jgi:hypothetical protein